MRGAGVAAMLGLLYAALYGLLVSEDNALVPGAGLLFVILAALMVATRDIDWYRAAASPRPDAGRDAGGTGGRHDRGVARAGILESAA